MSTKKENDRLLQQLLDTNRRGDERIEMQLPCKVSFPSVWSGSQGGMTGNLHRKGLLVACNLRPGRELPAVGDTGKVHIELPQNEKFPPKYMCCDTTLVRIEELGNQDFQFAMRIINVDFQDICPVNSAMMDLDPESCSYIM